MQDTDNGEFKGKLEHSIYYEDQEAFDNVIQLSQAISLKRIADALENFNYSKVGEIVHMTVVQKAEK